MRCSCNAELEPDAAYCGVCGREVRGRRPSLVGLVLDGRFQIEAKIAVGGFATIYRATQVSTGADVALKVLHPEMTANPAVRARFRRESATLASLRDPHTVATYEAGETHNGTLYIAMELLRGESLLSRFLSQGALPWRMVVEMARAVCCSLGEAHARGIVHRDLKPANIHLESHAGCPDFVKVLDFGVAKVTTDSGLHDGNELTRAGEAIGTIDYMAPEQLIGAEVDARTDIFALGVVMYEMITGRRPFADASGPASLITALLTRTPAPPSAIMGRAAGAVPPELDGLILGCLQRDPQHRFRDVIALRDALDRLMLGPAAMTTSGKQWRRPVGDLDRTLVDSKPPVGMAGMDPAPAWQPERRPSPPMPMPIAMPQTEPPPMPVFDIKVVGTEVGPRPASRIGVGRILGWAIVLASAGVAIGAVIASAL
jgi:serine/threonine-protein kinase